MGRHKKGFRKFAPLDYFQYISKEKENDEDLRQVDRVLKTDTIHLLYFKENGWDMEDMDRTYSYRFKRLFRMLKAKGLDVSVFDQNNIMSGYYKYGLANLEEYKDFKRDPYKYLKKDSRNITLSCN